MLVVDDEPDARLLLETTLSQFGAEVASADSVAEALDRFESFKPDVLLIDIGMPHEDGYALIRHVRARASSNGGMIPAVAITAYASERDRQATSAAGFQAHVTKPFEPSEVAHLVARLTEGAAGLQSRTGPTGST